ncbi:putative Inhibitor I9 domain-containing protein [Seiridium cardinale]
MPAPNAHLLIYQLLLQRRILSIPPVSPLNSSQRYQKPTSQLFHNSTSVNMPSYIVTCKDDASPDQVAAAKQHAKDQGGKITHEYNLIKGFAVEFPQDSVSTLESHEHVKAVEEDKEMKTQ